MIDYLNSIINNQILFIIMLFIFGIVSACTPCFLGNLTIYLKHINNSSNKIKSTLILILGVVLNLLVVSFIFMKFNSYFSLNNDYINLFIGLLLIFIGFDIAFPKKVISCKIVKKKENSLLYFLNGFVLMFITSTCISPILLYIMMNIAVNNTALGYFYILIYSLGFSIIILISVLFTKFFDKIRIKYSKIIYYINIILGIIIMLLGLYNIYLILYM